MNGDLHQPPPLLPPPRSVCDDCSSGDRLFLHNVSRTPKSPPQKLCTSCVLKHYHKSFCAECFEFNDANSLSAPSSNTATTTGANRLLMCIRCDNWSHVYCPKANTPKSPYLCPLCSPGFKYFDYRKPSKENSNDGNQALGKDDAKRLYTAARISAITMNKAVATARMEAERRVKEAALARKRAKEAIDHVFVVSAKVGAKRKETAATAAAAAAAAAAVVLATNGSAALMSVNYAPVRLERNGGELEANNGDDDRKVNVNGNGAIVKVPVPVTVITPHQQNNSSSGGGGGSSSGKNGSNVGQPQSK